MNVTFGQSYLNYDTIQSYVANNDVFVLCVCMCLYDVSYVIHCVCLFLYRVARISQRTASYQLLPCYHVAFVYGGMLWEWWDWVCNTVFCCYVSTSM